MCKKLKSFCAHMTSQNSLETWQTCDRVRKRDLSGRFLQASEGTWGWLNGFGATGKESESVSSSIGRKPGQQGSTGGSITSQEQVPELQSSFRLEVVIAELLGFCCERA